MTDDRDFTQGNIGGQIVRFAAPIMFALLLQSLYGAVDLLIVGRFGDAAQVSAVANGTAVIATLTYFITALSVGSTVAIGQSLGAGRKEEAGRAMGASIAFFFAVAVAAIVIMTSCAPLFVAALRTPAAAVDGAVKYTRICGAGAVFIVYYNLIGSVFRGFGDSGTPLATVALATVFNIAGDLLLVGVFGMGPAGAAAATVAAQAASVLLSVAIVKRRGLPFDFRGSHVKWNGGMIRRIVRVGMPLAIQDFMVSLSFLLIAAIVNSIGLVSSAAYGIGEKLIQIFMLVPISAEQALAAYVAQNYGAGKLDRAREALCFTMRASFVLCVAIAAVSWFGGEFLSSFFSTDPRVVVSAGLYLKAIAIEMLLLPVLFCYIGYFNGRGETRIVMLQGILGALGLRVPASFLLSRHVSTSLFVIGLATSIADVFIIVILASVFRRMMKRDAEKYG